MRGSLSTNRLVERQARRFGVHARAGTQRQPTLVAAVNYVVGATGAGAPAAGAASSFFGSSAAGAAAGAGSAAAVSTYSVSKDVPD